MSEQNVENGMELKECEIIHVFESLFETDGDAMILSDARGRIVSLNAQAARMLGYPPHELLGELIERLVPGGLAEKNSPPGDNFNSPDGAGSQTHARHKDGCELSVNITSSALQTKDGLLRLTHLRDQSELLAALESSQREGARAQALARMAARLNRERDLPSVVAAVCEETPRALGFEAATLSLYDGDTDALYLEGIYGLPNEYFRQQYKPTSPAPLDDRFSPPPGRLQIIGDVQAVPDLPNALLYAALNVRTMVAVELRREDELVGALNLLSVGQAREFHQHEVTLLRAIADQAAQAISTARLIAVTQKQLAERQDVEERVSSQLRRMTAFRNIYMAINASTDLRLTLQILVDELIRLFRVDAADILFMNPRTQTLEFGVGSGFRTTGLEHARWRIGEGYAGRVAMERRITTVSLYDPDRGKVEGLPEIGGEPVVAYHAAPLIAKGQVKGVLELFNRTPLSLQGEAHDLIELFANQAAIAIDNSEMFEHLQRSNFEMTRAYDVTIEGFARALDHSYDEPVGHTRRVADLAVQMAVLAGVPSPGLVHIRRGALLHDIGKVRLADGLLRKTGVLTEEQRAILRQYPLYAVEWLSDITYLQPALDIPYCFHEKWDGSGYPRGLAGEDIPLAARIFAVAEAWDVLRSERPYRRAWTDEEAREYIQKQAGCHFDPKLVEMFLQMDV